MSLTDTKVIKLYSLGQSCEEVARQDRCSETTMYNRLISLGVKMRSRSEANKVFPDFVFIRLYNLGLSVSQVGRLLKVDSSTVTKRLHTIMFPLRSRGVASRIRYTEKEFVEHFMVSDIVGQLGKLTV